MLAQRALLKFSRRDSMYVPAMPDDTEDVAGNFISFEGICQVRSSAGIPCFQS